MYFARYGAAIALAWLALPCAQAQSHPFTVKDDISMTRISDPRANPSVSGSNIVWPSPDGRWAAIVTSRGILRSDKIESSIVVFNLHVAAEALHERRHPLPGPETIASVVADPYRLVNNAHEPVIKGLRWSDDSKTLYFMAVDAKGSYQLCSAVIDGSGLHPLTPEEKDVGQFDVVGKTIVFTAADPGTHLIDPGRTINRDATDITGARLQEILFPGDTAARSTELFRLYTLKRDGNRSTIHQAPAYRLLDIPYLSAYYPFRASPTPTEIVKLEPPLSVPQSWARYPPIKGFEQLRLTHGNDPRLLRADNVLRPLEYTLINLSTGRRVPLLHSPNARSLGYLDDANRVVWTRDAKRVLVTNTFLPGTVDSTENSANPYPCAVASVDLPTFMVRCLYFEKGIRDPKAFHLQDVAFGRTSDDVRVLLHDGFAAQIVRHFTLEKSGWSLASTQSLSLPIRVLSDRSRELEGDRRQLKIFVHQTLNDPPTLWISDSIGNQRELWDPNPQFQHMQFGLASLYRWKDNTGRAWSGILVKPVGYVPGKRYPLVLQMYGYVDGQFVTDGLYPTAFAARELASAGIMVLQIRKQPDTTSEEDPEIALEGYRSAIARLAAAGLVDRRRVGVVGFSWTCWYAVYALVKQPTLFAAATIADGLDNSYMQYKLFAVEFYPLQRQMDKIRGGGPWGTHLQHWVDTASEFHLDHVRDPVRIEAINPSSVLQEWGLYSSLRLLGKPVDFIYFPNGTHIHQRPLERLESQQGDVDWFRFWLKGEVDPDPSKRTQYKLWAQMRQTQENDASKHALVTP
jgi:dipeptidyl aminopeptidase/acylaminoacyl peptidase